MVSISVFFQNCRTKVKTFHRRKWPTHSFEKFSMNGGCLQKNLPAFLCTSRPIKNHKSQTEKRLKLIDIVFICCFKSFPEKIIELCEIYCSANNCACYVAWQTVALMLYQQNISIVLLVILLVISGVFTAGLFVFKSD